MANSDSPAQGGALGPGGVQAGNAAAAGKGDAAGPAGDAGGQGGAGGISLDDLMAKQKALLQTLERVAADKNASADQLTRLSKEAQQQASDLEDLANRFAAQEQSKASASAKGRTLVQLTPLQRWWIYAQTGVDIDVLSLDDMTGTLAASMPMTDPMAIGRMALAEAQRRQARAWAQAEAQKKLNDALSEIEAQGSAEVREHVKQLKRDPNFLGGALAKKDA